MADPRVAWAPSSGPPVLQPAARVRALLEYPPSAWLSAWRPAGHAASRRSLPRLRAVVPVRRMRSPERPEPASVSAPQSRRVRACCLPSVPARAAAPAAVPTQRPLVHLPLRLVAACARDERVRPHDPAPQRAGRPESAISAASAQRAELRFAQAQAPVRIHLPSWRRPRRSALRDAQVRRVVSVSASVSALRPCAGRRHCPRRRSHGPRNPACQAYRRLPRHRPCAGGGHHGARGDANAVHRAAYRRPTCLLRVWRLPA